MLSFYNSLGAQSNAQPTKRNKRQQATMQAAPSITHFLNAWRTQLASNSSKMLLSR